MTKRQKTSTSVIDTSNDSNSQDKTNKKERADNWAVVEVQTLHKGIENRRDTFYGPPDQTSKKSREEAWKQITQEINAVSQCTRTVEQVMKKFKNEKCRAKRKYTDAEKNAQNSTPNTINGAGLSQQQLQHHMTTTNTTTMPSQSSINVVKLTQASQNVAKTMIDIPGGHVQQIQMPNDDQNQIVIMVPEMDQMLGAINNQQHNHHGQHTLQAINNGQGVVNSAVGNHMMTRAIQSTNMCSVGGDVSNNEHHMANNVASNNSNNLAIASNQISVNTPTIMHHRNSVDQGTNNQVQQGMSQHHHQLHQQQQQNQQHQHAQQQQHQQQQQHHQNHSASLTGSSPLDSQIKNLLVNILLNRDDNGGQQTNSMVTGIDYNKQRNEWLAVIANNLSKIESHMSKIAKVATSVITQPTTPNNNNNNNLNSNADINPEINRSN